MISAQRKQVIIEFTLQIQISSSPHASLPIEVSVVKDVGPAKTILSLILVGEGLNPKLIIFGITKSIKYFSTIEAVLICSKYEFVGSFAPTKAIGKEGCVCVCVCVCVWS